MVWGGEPQLEDRGLSNLTQGLELPLTDTTTIDPVCQRMIEDMTARNLGPASHKSRLRAYKRFAAWLQRAPDTATADDIRLFQLHLAETNGPCLSP
jgi:hypothetical protein